MKFHITRNSRERVEGANVRYEELPNLTEGGRIDEVAVVDISTAEEMIAFAQEQKDDLIIHPSFDVEGGCFSNYGLHQIAIYDDYCE